MLYVYQDGDEYYTYENTSNEFYIKYSVVLFEGVVQLKLITETTFKYVHDKSSKYSTQTI